MTSHFRYIQHKTVLCFVRILLQITSFNSDHIQRIDQKLTFVVFVDETLNQELQVFDEATVSGRRTLAVT